MKALDLQLVPSVEYVAALAELGAAALSERQARRTLTTDPSTPSHLLVAPVLPELERRAEWRAAQVRTEKAVDRLEMIVNDCGVSEWLVGGRAYKRDGRSDPKLAKRRNARLK